jgi:two-component system OmpR family response regulator
MHRELQRRVLVVDDDAEIRNMLGAALRGRELAIDSAADGATAIGLLSANAYSVVLLDIMMPGVDGFSVLDAIESGERAPVVLVVSGADRSVLERLDTRKIHGVVRKPFDPHEVAGIVSSCADIRGRRQLETMAIAAALSGPLLTWLSRG